jgi:signal transduction histidine kinase
MHILRRLFLFLWIGGGVCHCGAEVPTAVGASGSASQPPLPALTNVAQFRTLSSLDLNRGRPLALTGTVTLVDTNRNMLVLQDATGAMALYPDQPIVSVQPGQLVSLKAASASPYVVNFPDYPYRPTGRDIQTSFEAPSNWGDYHLTRMSGFLHPPVTGDYTFWIASDNSSGLWLSTSESPVETRRIAFVKEGDWVAARDWTRFPSQRSEPLFLRADRVYYIEAFQEQLTEYDNLAVAWQGPGLKQSVIDGRYLSPWSDEQTRSVLVKNSGRVTNGVLREYWTNYSIGNLAILTSAKPLVSGLAVHGAELAVLSPASWPESRHVDLGQRLPLEDNYRWVEAEGAVSFMGSDGATASLELTAGQNRTQVRVTRWNGSLPRGPQHWYARVKGVCEGVYNAIGQLVPGFIWVPAEHGVSFFEPENTNQNALASSPLTPTNANPVLGGYYYTHGVVTFSDQVLNKECLFIQEANGSIFISQAERLLRPRLQVGQEVEIGGVLLPGKYAPGLRPVVVNMVGWKQLPEPVIQPAGAAVTSYRDGQWTELEGVVRSVNANGTLLLMGKRSPISIWIGRVTTKDLEPLVDSTLRVRGVMSLGTHDFPLLLIPSRSFVEVKESPPANLFAAQPRLIASLKDAVAKSEWVHRVKVAGTVTYRDDESFFLQDESGGARVQIRDKTFPQIGDDVEVTGFPDPGNSIPVLTEAQARPLNPRHVLEPRRLDLNELVAAIHSGTLLRMNAILLAQKTRGASQVLELQAGQRVFEAVLGTNRDKLPGFTAGSLLEITGVCIIELVTPPAAEQNALDNLSMASMQILLRGPSDVVLLKGPPWWTWQRTAALIGLLLTVLAGAMLRILFLNRRFERQQAARLAFARQLLQSQEGERRRIAANLHDSLGQNLLAIKNQAHLAMQSAPDEAAWHQRLEDISGTALQALEDVRQITHDLRPYQLDRLGLTQAIRATTRRVSENCPIVFASHVDEVDGVFDKESEIHIYRIVQEGINNVIKHSGATEAAVVVKMEPGCLSISIRDNGRGFESGEMLAEDSPAAGFGLSGIRERAQIMGGVVKIDSSPGQGVNLKAEIPLPQTPKCNPE